MTTLRCGDRAFPIGERTIVMGIVNVTPDSFSDGGRYLQLEAAVAHAEALLAAGADVLDLGGESTRPGAVAVDPEQEQARVLPVVERLVARGIRNLSIDTRHASTARACLAAGAAWINDVSALQHDPAMGEVAAGAEALVLMHARQAAHDRREDHVRYGDVLGEVHGFLAERVAFALNSGVDRERIIVDPGLGFGKTVEDNLRLLAAGARFAGLGAVLVGPSRKRFLGAVTGLTEPADRDTATAAAVACAVLHGAHIVRVHDVKGTVAAVKVLDAVMRGR